MRAPSLLRRVFLNILLMLLLLFMGGSWLGLHHTQHQIDTDADAQLINDAHTIWTLIREDIDEGANISDLHLDFKSPDLNAQDREILQQYAHWRAVRIWQGNRLVAQSDNLLGFAAPKSPTGFTHYGANATQWRIYSVFVPQHHITVEVWENLRNRHRLLFSIARGLLTAGLLIFPLLVALLWLGIRHGLNGLILMAQRVAQRQPNDLSPIVAHNLPSEVLPLHHAINDLLARVAQSVAQERQFIDNVAHELKTPLAALRLQGELIAHAPTATAQHECIAELLQGIDRTTAMFEQLLRLSRIPHLSIHRAPVALLPLLQEALAQRVHMARAKNIDLSLESTQEVFLHSNAALLAVMVGALLDNAIKFTPAGGSVQLHLDAQQLSVTDTGIGIAPAQRTRVFERFVRGDHNSDGSGLGLSIVHAICQHLGLNVQLCDAPTGGGLQVMIGFKIKC